MARLNPAGLQRRKSSVPVPEGCSVHWGSGTRERAAVLLGDAPGGLGVGTWRRHEDGGAVVPQLFDALLDVGERSVVAALRRAREVRPREPAAGQLLDRGHVDDPV